MASRNIALVNAKEVNLGASDAPELAVIPLNFSFSSLITNSEVVAMSSTLLENFINEFATQRGYVTTVTPTVVRDHIENSIQLLEVLAYMLKIQNASKKVDQKGNLVDGVFTRRVIGIKTTKEIFVDGTAHTTSLENNLNLSNSVWAQSYLSILPQLKLPRGFANMIYNRFVGYYALNSGAMESYISYIPIILKNNSDVKAAFATLAASLRTRTQTYPDLNLLMSMIGWNATEAIDLNFTRDLTGNTIVIIDEPDLRQTLLNSYVFWKSILPGITTDADTDKLLYTTDVNNSTFMYEQFASVSVEELINLAIHGGRFIPTGSTGEYPNCIFVQTESGTATVRTALPVGIGNSATISGLVSVDPEIIFRMLSAERQYTMHIGIDPIAEISFSLAGAPDYIVFVALTTALEPSNCFILPSLAQGEVALAIAARETEMLFNDEAMWREMLQKLVLKQQ